MKKGDLVKWKADTQPWTLHARAKLGVVVDLGPLNHLGANKLPPGAFVYWPKKGVFWTPISQLEIVSEAG